LQKFLLQLAVSIAFVLLLRYFGFLTPNLYIPFVGVSIPLPEPVYLAFAAFVIVGTVNAVNITDGVDGLVTGVTIPVSVFFAATAFVWGSVSLGIFASALTAGLVVFLFFNFHPAKVFMGDTAVCALAFALDMPLILVPVGIVYIIETLSDIIQVVYFKITRGKRVFKMAPLHHHFEMCGWSERKLFFVFSAVSLVFSFISFLAVAGRYSM
jgi:phospho-N-acetylmuramoyl-pentapeptide-transferase